MPDPSPASAAGQRKPDPLATIEIAKGYLSFSAGHFTIFSATERENLHGHNWRVGCEVTSPVGDTGLCFDYGKIKRALAALCAELDERVLLPARSPYLDLTEDDGYVVAHYADERIPFLTRDVLVLQLANITVEELAGWFLTRLLDDPAVRDEDIRALRVRVSSGVDQWAVREWRAA